jgi:hypothetical protein
VRAVRALVVLAIAGAGLALAPVADASSSLTWSGQSTVTEDWSAPANWEGGSAPLAGEDIGTLSFPELTSTVCLDEPATHRCYVSYNDVSGLTAESVQIDDGDEYLIGGEELSIGSMGLSASPAVSSTGGAVDFIEAPLRLSASQKWSIVGRSGGELGENGLLLAGALNGSGSALTIELDDGPLFVMAGNDAEVGPVTIDGANTDDIVANGIVSFDGGDLDSSDEEPVDLNHVFFYGAGAVGHLNSNSADIAVASGESRGEGTLTAASATFDSASLVDFEITGSGSSAGTDYSHLVSSGAINLGRSLVGMVVTPPAKGKSCPSLSVGQEFTFVSSTKGIEGEFGNAPESHEIPIQYAKACEDRSQTIQIEYHESGGVQTVTGIVEAAKKKHEEEAAAEKKKHEEEAAAEKKKHEEEATAEKKKHEEEIQKAEAEKKTKEEVEALKKKFEEEEEAAAKKKHEEELVAASAKRHQEEEATAAANRHDEEEAAATKKREEEAANKDKSKPLTRAQKLAKALKQCKKEPKKKRAGCIVKAKKLYGAKPKDEGRARRQFT